MKTMGPVKPIITVLEISSNFSEREIHEPQIMTTPDHEASAGIR